MKILGYRIKNGEYEGHAYNNYYFYVVVNPDEYSHGEVVDTVKAKASIVDLMCNAKKIDVSKLIGMTISDINYDSHGNFKSFVF